MYKKTSKTKNRTIHSESNLTQKAEYRQKIRFKALAYAVLSSFFLCAGFSLHNAQAADNHSAQAEPSKTVPSVSEGTAVHKKTVSPQENKSASPNLAVVNGKPIPKEQAEALITALTERGQPDTPDLRNAIRERFISLELFAQEATAKNLEKKPEIKVQIELATRDALARQLIKEHLLENPVKEAEIKIEYERNIKNAPDKQYHAQHILVETENEAKKIIESLEKGAKFEELAKDSKDAGSKNSGGDLGWNAPNAFVPKFSEALVGLKENTFTHKPVHSEFGYHVIRLLGTRKAPVPAFDEKIKAQIRQHLEHQKVQKLESALRAKAKIE